MNRPRALAPWVVVGVGGWPLGAGALKARPGAYQIASNWDGRFGCPGPREVADLTGIASGYRVIKIIKSFDINIAVTTNGTDTKVYRKETTWVVRATISSRVATDAVSFKNVIAIAFGEGFAYQFATDSGAGALSFAASTKTADNAERANYFLVQNNGLLTPRVMYCVDPNEVYYTTDLTDTDAAGVNASYVGDTAATQDYFTSIAEEPGTGRVLFGKRHALYTIHQEPGYDGVWEKLTEDYPDPIADAGGQSDRNNFENPALVGGLLYYPVQGYDILVWPSNPVNRWLAPRWASGCRLPRMDLPINALVGVSGYLVAFLGSKNTSTLKSGAYFPGGASNHLAATYTTASEMWVGSPVNGSMVWHGVLLECTNPLRYAWFDEDDGYLYMASGDSESNDLQMTRCLFTIDNPLERLTSSNVVLNAGTWKMEPGPQDWGDTWGHKRAEYIKLLTMGLADSTPSLEVEYRTQRPYDATAFESGFITFTDEETADLGTRFFDETYFRELSLRFVGVGTGNTYAILLEATVWASEASDQDQEVPAR